MTVSTESLGDQRFALLLAVSQYADPELRRLRAPAADAVALRDLLADPEVGAFAVTSVFDERAQAMRLAVEEFLTDRRPDDVILVYLSCHGLVDVRRRLYFAARDTLKNRLAASGVEAHWLLEQLEECRARRQVVVLDCCFSGAFAQGAKGDTDLALGERLMGQGRGRVVLTASRGTEYSFEGDPVEGQPPPGSVFTSALVGGITSGEADADDDGYISVDEAYTYAFEKIREAGGQQTPQRWLYGAEGSIVLARKPVEIGSTTRTTPAPGPAPPEEEIPPAPAPVGDAAGPRPPSRRVRPWLLGGLAAALLVLAGALGASLLNGEGGGGSPEGGATGPLAANELAVEAPWRLVVRNEDVGDGCTVTVIDEAGERTTVEDVYDTKYFQMHSSGTVEWEANHPGCDVFQEPTADEQELPILWPARGDTPAFRADDTVTVDVLNFQGSDGCDLEMLAVEDGRTVTIGTVATKARPEVMDTHGVSPVYIGDTTCVFRITDGG